MTFDIGMYAVAHALFSQTVAAAAINQPPTALQPKAERFATNTEKRQNIEWSFELFQTGGCTGESDPYSGIGTTACRNGILNGGALASIKNHGALIARCSFSATQTVRLRT
jgi:hypothetical protein